MRLFGTVIILFFSISLWAQEERVALRKIWEDGLPFITNYSTEDYKAASQNWCIIQDDNGIIYAGNNAGILQYDGSFWRTIKTPKGNPVRSLAKDKSGRIYVGGIGEIGYLTPNAELGMSFTSLAKNLDSAYRDFGNAWFTFAVNEAIYFICDKYILRWANDKFTVWKEQEYGVFGFSWMIKGEIFVDVRDRGLMKLDNDSLTLVKGGQQFIRKGLMGLFPHQGDSLIAITSSKEIFLFDGVRLIQAKTGHTQLKLMDAVYHGTQLSNGNYALATTGSGFYLMDQSGTLKSNITKQMGLTSDAVYSAYEDAEGDVWLATDNGISRIELNSSLRLLSEKHGVDENTFDIEYFNNTLYITNSKGVFQLIEENSKSNTSRPYFKKIDGIDNLTFYCHVVGDELIISNYDGIFTLNKRNALNLITPDQVAKVESPSAENPHHLLFDTNKEGIGELVYSNGQWKAGKKKIEINANAYSFARSGNGNIFINTRRKGIYEIDWTEVKQTHSLNDSYKLIHHDTTRGLSSLTIKSLEKVGNTIYVSTDKSIHRYNELTRSFETDSALMNSLSSYTGSWVNEIVEANNDDFWVALYHNYESHVFKKQNDTLNELTAAGRFSNLLITKIFDSKLDMVLFGSNKGIVMFNEHQKSVPKNIFNTSIRKILSDKDSVIYAGHVKRNASSSHKIDYAHNDLQFQFSLPSYDFSSKNKYQYFLEGFNQTWSAWSSQSHADFTNLTEGDYVFRVRGINVYGQISEEDRYAFTILPPLHRTWWAYTLYLFSLIVAIVLIVKWRSGSLRQEKIVLENIIRERTQKISQQTEKLREMDRLKSSFFANISHEFRTPLTLILGPLEEELKNRPVSNKAPLLLMKRNANRLLELVNQLLDLSKLEAGKMELHIEHGNMDSFLKILAASFDSWAQHKQIRFVQIIETSAQSAWYDADKVEKIITNLLANAFKFTLSNGTVTFTAVVKKNGDKNILVLTVSDTGKGIPPEEQELVFSSFYQTRHTIDSNEGGTGLGLPLVKELIKLYGGTITLQSVVGNGTVFFVTLPIDKEAFPAGQIIENSSSVSLGRPSLTNAYDSEEEGIEHEPLPDGKDSILIAEDNADLKNYLSSILEKEFTVVSANNGEEAWALALQIVPNLILTDLMMPRMDGFQLTEKIKRDERTCHIPVIVLTARNEQQSRLEGLQTGADDYLTKPFSREELLVRIKNLIEQRKLLATRFRERILVPITSSQEIPLDDKFLQKVRLVIETNIGDASFTVEKLAGEINLNRTQLLRKVKALTGLSPNDFIKDLRLKKAADMIRQKADTITQIGYAVGFSDQSYFTKCFKKEYGLTPTEYSLQTTQKKEVNPKE